MSDPIPFQGPTSAANDYTMLAFLVQQIMRGQATATIVRVEACSNAGELAPVGTVDVTPMVAQVNGAGQPTPHDTIYGLVYVRWQGGNDAVILDPKPGDLGLAVFASRDISNVKAAKGPGNPGSSRVFNYADGIYVGGLLNGSPTQFVRFSSAGIETVSPTKIRFQAPVIEIAGAVHQITGDASSFTGPLAAQGTDVHTHVHGGVQPGGSDTGPPV